MVNGGGSEAESWAVLLDLPYISTRPGATPTRIDDAEGRLHEVMPPSLRALYLQTDGVWHRDGQWDVIWPLQERIARNGHPDARRFGLAFGDDGTGNPFCIDAGGAIAYWSEINAESTWLSGDLESFWKAWCRGDLPPH
ncbi:SMI1/KNR4 family protein [Agromyces sp. NPDC058136]|uniref:SMI1/KNR4 family protein n=1 Tax=Agromyces sp. NPDC058136 TaxID=3346354 RepID=UPI0036DDDF9D